MMVLRRNSPAQINFDLEKLAERCDTDEKDFFYFARDLIDPRVLYGYPIHDQHDEQTGKFRRNPKSPCYLFVPNGGKVLAVAHMDTVFPDLPPGSSAIFNSPDFDDGDDSVFYHGNLDDRLGMYVILDLLPNLVSRPYDILLTTGEESIGSSASEFFPEVLGFDGKRYNWIFEFDRNGTDVVMYQYYNFRDEALLLNAGFSNVNIGSYTDIVELERFGVSAFNIGCAYYGAHTINCHVRLPQLRVQVRNFVNFYHQNYHTRLDHDPERSRRDRNTANSWGYRFNLKKDSKPIEEPPVTEQDTQVDPQLR